MTPFRSFATLGPNKLNGFLCVDAVSGEEFFRLSGGSKTEEVSEYLALVVQKTFLSLTMDSLDDQNSG